MSSSPASLDPAGAVPGNPDLAHEAARGGLLMLAQQGVQVLFAGASTVILARALSPEEHGVFAVAAGIVGFAQLVRGGGLALGTIQRARIDEADLSSVFWINVLALFAVAVLLGLSGPFAARVFAQPDLAGLVPALAAVFFVNGLSIHHDALLRRRLRFGAVAAIQVSAAGVQAAAAITGAVVLGLGVWSFVAGAAASAFLSTALSFILSGWRPSVPRVGPQLARWLREGLHFTAFDLLNYLARTADNLLIAHFVGVRASGLYTRAYNLFMLPITQVRQPLADVALPVLSSIKDDAERYRRFYLQMLRALAYLSIPVSTYCALEADFVVGVVLGPKWSDAAPILRLLAVAGVAQAVGSTRGLLLVSRGMSERCLRFGWINALVTIASFVAGLPFGAAGVAASYATASTVMLIPTLRYAFEGTKITLADFLGVVARPLALSLIAASVTAILVTLAQDGHDIMHWVGLPAFFGTYAVLSWRSSEWRSVTGALLRPRCTSA